MKSVRVALICVALSPIGCGSGAASDGGAGGQPSAAGTASSAGTAGTTANSGGSGAGGGSAGGGSAGSGSSGSGNQAGSNAGGAPVGGAGGTVGGGGGGGGSGGAVNLPMNQVFSQCRLHFGTIDAKAKEHPELIQELDFFTPSWMGQSDTFDQKYVCDEAKPGAVLGKQVPIVVAYVSAFYVKRHHGGLCDCNVNSCGQMDGKPNDLCHFGAQYVKQDAQAIVEVYKKYAEGYANCYGTTRPIVFEMEPDWYQYTISEQSQPFTKAEAGELLGQYVSAMKQALPNAYFSIDISPWVDDNGATNGKDWYSHFDLSKFMFANTSGGSTLGADAKIRSDNKMTWAGVGQVTGKTILADTGYGANGISAGHDPNWDDANNLNARIADGVISISQYNPKADWASTISGIRSQLKTPSFCP